MKCPKCGYLGFENVESCRNCGYRFSLTTAAPAPDLTLSVSRDVEPLADLSLIDSALKAADERLERERAASPSGSKAAAWGDAVDELPLFGAAPSTDNAPLITRASPPRTPLSVRRATPDVSRLRTETRPSLLDFSLSGLEPSPTLVPVQPQTLVETAPGRLVMPSRAVAAATADSRDASVPQRYAAAAIDAAILLAIDLLVLYFTMQICGLLLGDVNLIPRAPLLAFLVAQNVAYLVVFTAGGQTIGKMVLGIRVVGDDGERPPSVSRAAIRTLAWIPLALPIGLGLLTALLGDDQRGLHDRVANTRVVRATA